LRADIVTAGSRVALLQADVADSAAVTAMFSKAEAELGPVSILVNNAGVSAPATLESHDAGALERMRAVNVNDVIHTVCAVMAGMKAHGYGRIVNIASNGAIGTALPGTTCYAATKAEVLIVTRRFAMELGRSGITVNAVCPGMDRALVQPDSPITREDVAMLGNHNPLVGGSNPPAATTLIN
jgi:NAD(P)-dependent dehydrogenase (short-subunit alcohol dehydrogenase family)